MRWDFFLARGKLLNKELRVSWKNWMPCFFRLTQFRGDDSAENNISRNRVSSRERERKKGREGEREGRERQNRFYLSVHPSRCTSGTLNNVRLIRFKRAGVIAHATQRRMVPLELSGTCTDQYSGTLRFPRLLPPARPPGPSALAHLPQLNIGIDFHGSFGRARRPLMWLRTPGAEHSRV